MPNTAHDATPIGIDPAEIDWLAVNQNSAMKIDIPRAPARKPAAQPPAAEFKASSVCKIASHEPFFIQPSLHDVFTSRMFATAACENAYVKPMAAMKDQALTSVK